MRRTAILVSALTFLAGRGTDPGQSTAAFPDTVPVHGVPGIPPSPNLVTADSYIADLDAINSDIVHGKPDKAIDRGRNQCSSVAQWPSDQAKLVGLTEKRFTSPDHPGGFGPATSALILAVVRKHLCPND